MSVAQAEVLIVETQLQDEVQNDNHDSDRPLSVRDRIRLMNLDASTPTSNWNGISSSDSVQHQDQRQQPLSSNKFIFPSTDPNSLSNRTSYDDSSFNFVRSAVVKKEVTNHRQDIFSDPGVGFKSESHSAAAAITKWRKRRSVDRGSNNSIDVGNVDDNFDSDGELRLNDIRSPLNEMNENPEWTISDLTRQKKFTRESSETSKMNQIVEKFSEGVSESEATMKANGKFEQPSIMKLNAANACQRRVQDIVVQNSGDALLQSEAAQYPPRNASSNDNFEHTATTSASFSLEKNEPIKSEGFLENVKLKAVNTSNRNAYGKQSDSGTFVIPKLRPVRKAPHTLAIIMQQTSNKPNEQLANTDADLSQSNTTSNSGKVNHYEKKIMFHTSLPEEGPVVAQKDNSKSTIKIAQLQILNTHDCSDPSTIGTIEKSTFSSVQKQNMMGTSTSSKKAENTPPRSKVSDRIKAFSSVYSGSNQNKFKPSVPTPPKRMKVKKGFVKHGSIHEEDASHDSSERVTVLSHDDDSISVLTPMNFSNTPARLGAQPPTPNSYSSEAAYTAASSGDGAVGGSVSSKHKQQMQMRYAKFDTPDVSHDGDNTSINTSSNTEEQLSVSAIKNSLQSKLEQDKKKAFRKRIPPKHVKVPSVLIAAQKKAQDLKPQWGDSFESNELTSTSKLLSRSDIENVVDVRNDLCGMFDCEEGTRSTKSNNLINKDSISGISLPKSLNDNQKTLNNSAKEEETFKDNGCTRQIHKKQVTSTSQPSCSVARQVDHVKEKADIKETSLIVELGETKCTTDAYESFPADERDYNISVKCKKHETQKPIASIGNSEDVHVEETNSILLNKNREPVKLELAKMQQTESAQNVDHILNEVPSSSKMKSEKKKLDDNVSIQPNYSSSSDTQISSSTQISRLSKADAVKKLIKRRRQRNKNKFVNQEKNAIDSSNDVTSITILSSQTSANKNGSVQTDNEQKKKNVDFKNIESIPATKKSSLQKSSNNMNKTCLGSSKDDIDHKNKDEQLQSDSRATLNKLSTLVPMQSKQLVDAYKTTNHVKKQREKLSVSSKYELMNSSRKSNKDQSTDSEGEDTSGFIPMKSNASKDRRSRFMKATSMKRKMLTLTKSNSNDEGKVDTKHENNLSKHKVEETDELPILPPSIVRSIKDDKNLETIIDQKLTMPDGPNPSKNTSWCLDSDCDSSAVKFDDEPEPFIDSFIQADLSPIKSVNQSKHIFESAAPYQGSPDGHGITDEPKDKAVPIDLQRQATPKRRNSSVTTQILRSNASDSGSQVSQPISAQTHSDIGKKCKLLGIPNLMRSVPSDFLDSNRPDPISAQNLQSVENLSEASSGFKSTSSSRFSARVNEVLANRSKVSNLKQNEVPQDFTSILVREIFHREQKSSHENESLEIYEENDNYPTQGLAGEDKENGVKHLNQVSNSMEYTDSNVIDSDSRNESFSSSEYECLDITDGQISVDVDEILAGTQEAQTEIKFGQSNSQVHELSNESNAVKDTTSNTSIISQNKTNTKGSWFPENMVDLAIDKLASDIVSKCEAVDLATAKGIGESLPFCGGNGENLSSIAPDSLNVSSMSAVRISNGEIPPSDENQQEGIEVEYIPTELVESLSEKNHNDPENRSSIMMHFNSQISGSIPLTNKETFFDLSMNDSSISQNVDKSSDFCTDRTSDFSTGRIYRRKYH